MEHNILKPRYSITVVPLPTIAYFPHTEAASECCAGSARAPPFHYYTPPTRVGRRSHAEEWRNMKHADYESPHDPTLSQARPWFLLATASSGCGEQSYWPVFQAAVKFSGCSPMVYGWLSRGDQVYLPKVVGWFVSSEVVTTDDVV